MRDGVESGGNVNRIRGVSVEVQSLWSKLMVKSKVGVGWRLSEGGGVVVVVDGGVEREVGVKSGEVTGGGRMGAEPWRGEGEEGVEGC